MTFQSPEARMKPPQFEKGENVMVLKTLALGIAAILLTLLVIVSAGARNTSVQDFNAAETYKKCVACHGTKAEKKFDATKSDDEHVQIILKGKKAEKPPHMPAYETKGINAEQAKALLDYMKSLRQ
jgi:cbb3-type cytochrome c oxidase subunit III